MKFTASIRYVYLFLGLSYVCRICHIAFHPMQRMTAVKMTDFKRLSIPPDCILNKYDFIRTKPDFFINLIDLTTESPAKFQFFLSFFLENSIEDYFNTNSIILNKGCSEQQQHSKRIFTSIFSYKKGTVKAIIDYDLYLLKCIHSFEYVVVFSSYQCAHWLELVEFLNILSIWHFICLFFLLSWFYSVKSYFFAWLCCVFEQ